MIGVKGDNRSVAKLYFLTISTTSQFLLIENSLFIILITPNIISAIYLLFFSDEYFNIKSQKNINSNYRNIGESRRKLDNNKKIVAMIKFFRTMFIFNLIISHIIILVIFSKHIFNILDIVDIRSPDISLELLYGLFTFNFCLVSPFLSEHFMEILNEEKPGR